jgi:hypothetical protein
VGPWQVARTCFEGPRFVLQRQPEKPQTLKCRSALPRPR